MDLNRYHFTSIDSTNSWAKHHAHEFPLNELTLITTDEQTAGRGRFNRQWLSPPKQNLYATFCFFLDKIRPDIHNISQVMAIAASKTLESFGFQPMIKWPNDILITNKKIGGILTEITSVASHLCIIVGIGINVNMPIETLRLINQPATSLIVTSGIPFEIGDILSKLQSQFMHDLELFLNEGFFPFIPYYRQHFFINSGASAKIHDGNATLEGVFHMINNDGSLSIQLADGSIKKCLAGELN